MPKKKQQKEPAREQPKRPWTLKDKAWVVLVALIVIVPMAWALTVAEGGPLRLPSWLMADLQGQMSDLRRVNPDLLDWSVAERDGVLEMELVVSSEATEEEIERWSVYFLKTAKSTVGLVTKYEYALTVRREE